MTTNREAMLEKLADLDAEHAKAVAGGGQRTAFPDPYQSRACPGKSVMHINPVRPGVGVPFYTIR